MVSETKSDNTFTVSQFLIDAYTPPFRPNRNNNGRGIMLFVREDIPLSAENHSMDGFYAEINLGKTKWFFCCSYSPNRSKIDFHLENPSLGLYSSHYENFIIMRDFNVEANDTAISDFSDT